MNLNDILGIFGSIVLVIGVTLPDRDQAIAPLKLPKNWLFVIGSALMLLYALLNYFNGGAIFFVMLELLVVLACILMMTHLGDAYKSVWIVAIGCCLVIWSLYLFEKIEILIFILGLIGVSLGYAFKHATARRDVAFIAGSLLIALFSFFEKNWIFFALNLLFAFFSALNLAKRRTISRPIN
ncbi:MAG: hypothetical protein R2830_03470 [Saprospiraceae bacterium]